jgi:hypothetical protein
MNDQPYRHDPRNRFEVANANRAAELRRSADKAAVRRNAALAANDAKSARPKTASGVLLDAKTAEAKRRRDNDLAAGRSATSTPPTLPLSPATMEAVTVSWLQLAPEFYNSEFNRTSMRNFVRKNTERNGPCLVSSFLIPHLGGSAKTTFWKRLTQPLGSAGRL